MSYPVYSTSVETGVIRRTNRVMARSKAAKNISKGEVYNCRKIEGSSSYSQHSWGNAVDLFVKSGGSRAIGRLANAVVYQVTHRTIANRGRKLALSQVIDHANSRIWTPSGGWAHYSGTVGADVHVSGSPLRTGVPPCAG